ncbi:mitochondrial dynamin GTPase Msp1 [Exophiala dermatitidis]|uniref:Adenosinetriphosphatase n=2 Tax=Exophiala dermatitidis TaxID=5970 RepID=H6C5P2_EXODN|nr:adenosinetriphosphatase [Exophiala dermatitidis NIH/UT8656]KAJ4523169.1 mitochondrial dynamin GTPase Msp1 [Exophiala dermatitidis]EHY59038.1 adenosinetriphosphatase [Exophiala dermatitidis NIH/UT8656]KAJ4546292.1 mitochondrial dynamin GTPase Msp1 [Exophiala dermatitidis]KAJ4560137.1 mitochondrial dynamin GTPase Msp1 [Exophiala dermatitidis]KAJ4567465.1 mitochondrial dynamin GTPase Msp1 [Exophiala dermatitidis]
MSPDRGGAWWHRILEELAVTAPLAIGGYYLVRYVLRQMNYDPEAEQKEQNRKQSSAILRRLDEPKSGSQQAAHGGRDSQRPLRSEMQLSPYEQVILQDLVFPEDIRVTFDDIGGLSDIIEELKESVIYPLTMPELYSNTSSLLSAPSGVLLYGQPGCGKTMLAKALAHESGACFINLHISTLTEKWFGDSNKLVNAVFSLARKLEPAIVFIDEIDAVLGTRRSGEHEASGMVKAEFMTHWDGLASASSSGRPQRILVLGATNRIQDIDDAILRRMPKKFPVSLPNTSQRLKILKIVLRDTKLDEEQLDLEYLARVMSGMSGSDIKEACREAAMIPVREMIKRQRESGQRIDQMKAGEVRGLRTTDFFRQSAESGRVARSITDGGEDNRAWSVDESSSDAGSRMEEAPEQQQPEPVLQQ